MREIVLDTETTGLDPNDGHKIVEIGCVELQNHIPTGKSYHQYINPERRVPKESTEIHGLDDKFLKNQPIFSKIVPSFLEFIAESKLIIHNASFDIKFLNFELKEVNAIQPSRVIDTLKIAREKFPGSPASLDALCRRFGIDNSNRKVHGALLDSEILAAVYLELIGGRQPGFGLGQRFEQRKETEISAEKTLLLKRPKKLPERITDHEAKAHKILIKKLADKAVWTKFL